VGIKPAAGQPGRSHDLINRDIFKPVLFKQRTCRIDDANAGFGLVRRRIGHFELHQVIGTSSDVWIGRQIDHDTF